MELREVKWDIVGRRRIWFALSSLFILAGLAAWALRGLNRGIDFTGGAMYTFRVSQDLSQDPVAHTAQARRIAQQAGVLRAQVQVFGKNEFLIRTSALTNEEAQKEAQGIQKLLTERYGGAELLSVELVGPVIGAHLRRTAVIALVIGCGLILLYITFRYEFRFAVAGVLALVHDVLVTIGACALAHIEINSPFVAAILTIIGYSINDTVIIFDRIRENWKLRTREDTFPEVANRSLWQTMVRSLNTSGTTLVPLIMLYFLGGPTIRDFAFTLLVGIITGAYSSIFTAAPLVVAWRLWDERRALARKRPREAVPTPSVQERRRARREALAPQPMPSNSSPPPPSALPEPAPEEKEAVPVAAPAAAPSEKRKKKKGTSKRGKRKKRY